MTQSMMTMELTVGSMIAHAARYHGDTAIVSVETDGSRDVSTWAGISSNAKKLGAALRQLGLQQGQRCATIAWNNRRHLEIYFGVSASGYVTHTVNPRLAPEQLIHVIDDAEDRILFFDRTFLDAISKLRPHLPSVQHFILMGPRPETATDDFPGLIYFDELLASAPEEDWPTVLETAPSALCYTSGTTGLPKGVLYTHRSTVLHALCGNNPDAVALSARDTVLPVVPMFHVSAWGVPYMAAISGSRLVLPGPFLDGESLVGLLNAEKVTVALGVPTIWMGLLTALRQKKASLPHLLRTIVGGAALAPSMIEEFKEDYDVDCVHAWGMTETSPLGTINQLLHKHDKLNDAEQSKIRVSQGRPPYGVQLRLVDENGADVPHDGRTPGALLVRGAWVLNQYFTAESPATKDGWFDTGDVATIDENGYLVITDRAKDIIKSGGEWISTVELENIAISHRGISNAAVIAAAHEKWDERPVLIAVRTDPKLTEDQLLDYYEGRIPNWQHPDRAVFVDELPLGATGKVQKVELRKEFGEILLSKVSA